MSLAGDIAKKELEENVACDTHHGGYATSLAGDIVEKRESTFLLQH
jgi:hypothetical protein